MNQGASESGYGQAFGSEGSARAFLSAQYAASASANVENGVQKAMANDGIFVVSFVEAEEDMTRQSCAEWDTTTMGTPPPEWDCPGY
jgi:hypothetical protein